ncbi:RagB/SusD family nutrient uptake outer membrane protein [Compostibacter hankyongensis]|uniref:RagB/SusD family nutrient uptake outer membrane protein n=1 Tax=Compostibacter hankyongensis TaxID=1007089 RepID=A0ABP8G3T8_9BACT
MNRIRKSIILTIAAALWLASCKNDKYLDITPDGRVSLNDVFTDAQNTESYLNTVYNYLPFGGIYYHYYEFLAAFTDDAQSSDAPTQAGFAATEWYSGSLTPSKNPLYTGNYPTNNGNRYERNWEGIRKVNTFLANIDKAAVKNESNRASMKAEARVLRAFFYSRLIRKYGGMPIIKEPLSPEYDFSTLKRNTFQECVDFIVEDCNAALAEANFTWRRVSTADAGRMTKAVAEALKTQVTLYAASPLWNKTNDAALWQKAAVTAKTALEDLLANGYQLYNNYGEFFENSPDDGANPKDKETILVSRAFGAQYPLNMLVLRMASVLNADKAGSCPTQELVDTYDMDNGEMAITGYSDADHMHPIINPASGYDDANPYVHRDPRFYATVWYNNAYYGKVNGADYYIGAYKGGNVGISNTRQRTHTGYYLRKYKAPEDQSNNSGNESFRFIRLAEVYLSYAEAENEAVGPDQNVYSAINAIRRRVGMPDLPAGLSKDDMRERIRRERRVEMPYEEIRFYDERRWKILDKSEKVTTGMSWTKNADGTFSNERIVVDRRKTWEDKYLILPIPLDEINKMPSFEQNPGW